MKRKDFYKTILLKCELDEDIEETVELESLEDWDSLALITMISVFKKEFGFTPNLEILKSCKTFSDVLNLAEDKYE